MTIIHSCYPKLPSPHSVGDSLVGYLSVTNWWLCKEQLLSLFNARTRKTPTQESSTALVPSKVSALHSKAQSGVQPWHRGGDTSRRRTVSLRRDWQNSYKQIFLLSASSKVGTREFVSSFTCKAPALLQNLPFQPQTSMGWA